MCKFYLDDSAKDIGIINPVVVIIKNVVVEKNSNIDDYINEFMQYLESNYNRIIQSNEYQGFKQLFDNMGYANQTPAGERLIKSFIKKGFKRINNIVDSYNLINAKYGCGIGMHDADKCFLNTQSIKITRSQAGSKIIPIFKENIVEIDSDDLVYGNFDGEQPDIFAWLGKKDVDSDQHKVDDNTNSLLLVVTGNQNTSLDFNKNICQEIFDLIKKNCSQASIEFLKTNGQDKG